MSRILYLHGFASSPNSSKARHITARLREAGAEVDIPPLDGGDFEHLTLSGQLRAIEEAAAGEPVALIGSSMGGYLAALYAARHAEVSRVVLLAPAFRFAKRWEETLGPARVAEWREKGSLPVFHYGDGVQRNLSCALLDDGHKYEDYPDFGQPALIFHGAHDEVVPARYSEEFGAAHANAQVEILDSGHELLNVLDYMTAKILQFVVVL